MLSAFFNRFEQYCLSPQWLNGWMQKNTIQQCLSDRLHPLIWLVLSSLQNLSRHSPDAYCRSDAVFENRPIHYFSGFPPNEFGHVIIAPLVTSHCAAVLPRCITFQKFALCANGGRLQSPAACLGCRIVCTTFEFAQKKDARPVGGRGISAFSLIFISANPLLVLDNQT